MGKAIKSAPIAAHVLPLDKTSYHAAVRASARFFATDRHGKQDFHHSIDKERVFSRAAMAFPFARHEIRQEHCASQLHYRCDQIRQSRWSYIRVGVGGGGTSIIINKLVEEESINRPFYAIDTFYGFTREDVDLEIKKRGKTDRYLGYRSNSKDWYTKTLIGAGQPYRKFCESRGIAPEIVHDNLGVIRKRR